MRWPRIALAVLIGLAAGWLAGSGLMDTLGCSPSQLMPSDECHSDLVVGGFIATVGVVGWLVARGVLAFLEERDD